MSKLTKKFMAGIFIILASVTLLSLFINTNFIERFLLYQQKNEMNRICDRLIAGNGPLEEIIAQLEETEDVVIAHVKENADNVELNQAVSEAFLNKGISLKKYWLWEQDQQDVMRDGRRMRLYTQDKLHYSVLVEYLSWDGNFLAAAKIIPSMDRTLSLVNQMNLLIFSGAGIVIFILIFFLVRRITVPLRRIGETAEEISRMNFTTLEIRTKDELEELAGHINRMSLRLKKSHQEMEELLSNVSHDLKTPVSLIKAYTRGMKDGMDDGTFLDTVISQNERMEEMIERLLHLEKIRQEEVLEHVCVSDCLRDVISDYTIQAKDRDLILECSIQPSLSVFGSRDAVGLICSNFLSNAVKYAAEGAIRVILVMEGKDCLLRVQNQVAEQERIDLFRIWEPFYVAEPSRNRDMTGTGLGLSLVRTAAQKYGYHYECVLQGDQIEFSIRFTGQ